MTGLDLAHGYKVGQYVTTARGVALMWDGRGWVWCPR